MDSIVTNLNAETLMPRIAISSNAKTGPLVLMKIKKTLVRLLTMFIFSPSLLLSAATAEVNENFDVELLVDGLPKSWSLNISPNNEIFVTDRGGSIIVIDPEGKKQYYSISVPDLFADGQGGLLDIEFHPNYTSNGWAYLSYSAGTAGANRLKVIRFKMPKVGNEISLSETIFVVKTDKNTPVHYGGRLAFLPDNTLLISTGDGFDYREQAQVKSSHLGKIIRVTDIGLAVDTNPFYSATHSSDNESFIYSMGHRNPQALLVSNDGMIISNEHGPAGGDEINIIEKGNNYGWPIITNGKDYSGAVITPFTEYAGMRQPDFDWTPSIAPSGMILYTSTALPSLTDHLLVTSLKFKQLRALKFDGSRIHAEQIVLPNFEYRLRDVVQDQQGHVLLLTDGGSAKIFKLVLKVKDNN